jgi:hypothetical protein
VAGYEPIVEDVFLTKGEPFVHYFECTADDPFPDGTTGLFRILYRDRTDTFAIYPAVLVEAGGVQIQIDAADADSIPDGYRWQLSVKTPSQPSTCWRRGPVWRRD